MRYVVVLCTLLASLGAAQDTKTLLLDLPGSKDPVKIVSVMDGTAKLKSNGHQYPNRHVWETTFNAGDDWLKDLSIVIKNVSEKKIVYVSGGCVLYETADWQAEIAKHASIPVFTTTNTVGRRPEEALYSAVLGHRLNPDTESAPFLLEPGQEFTMALEGPDGYPRLKSSVEEKEPMANIAACNGRISQVFFEDGTQWQGHRYLRADLEHPGHWIKMSSEEWSKSR
jgi:hypothetical protein